MQRRTGPLDRAVEFELDALGHLSRAERLAAEEARERAAAAEDVRQANRILDPMAFEIAKTA